MTHSAVKIGKTHPATAWLAVSVISMMFMGIYAFLVALSRAPWFNLLFSDQLFFKTALVTHVALSVVIWFLAFILFAIYHTTSHEPVRAVDYLPALGALVGVALIVVTPFTGPASPTLNNYVPVLKRGLYFTGLGVFFGFAALAVIMRAPALFRSMFRERRYPLIVTGSLTGAGFSLVIGVVCILLAHRALGGGAHGTPMFYESLFWGGGHVLQFSNTLGLMAVWGLLAARVTDERPIPDAVAGAVLVVMVMFFLYAPVIYLNIPVQTMESRQLFTALKSWGVAAGPVVLGPAILLKLRGAKRGDPVSRRGLVLSVALFGIGGLIALTIHGSDTRVPAHYHGVIGAVTLCFMAYALAVSVENGWLKVGEKWRKTQLTLYGVGQTLFVAGLFIGGYGGLPRKTFGAAQQLDSLIKYTGMSVMGVGGLLAVAGGVVFVIFMLMALCGREHGEKT